MSVTTDDASRFLFALPCGSDFKTSSARKLHIRQLNDVLHLSIQRGDLVRAKRAWSILLRCDEYNWKSMWKTGLLLATGVNHCNDGSIESVEYLKKAMRQQPEQQEAILQELVLQYTASDRFKEGLDELQLYLPSFPYQDNPILHLYAGLICFHLSNSSDNDDGNESLLVQAKGHLNRTLALDSNNPTAKAFVDEIGSVLERRRNMQFRDDQEHESDVDMNDGTNREEGPSKRKRIMTGIQ